MTAWASTSQSVSGLPLASSIRMSCLACLSTVNTVRGQEPLVVEVVDVLVVEVEVVVVVDVLVVVVVLVEVVVVVVVVVEVVVSVVVVDVVVVVVVLVVVVVVVVGASEGCITTNALIVFVFVLLSPISTEVVIPPFVSTIIPKSQPA